MGGDALVVRALLREDGINPECGVGVKAERGCQQLVNVRSLEGFAGAGLELLLRGIRELFDCHDEPFLCATPILGQTHTFKSPTARLKERFSIIVKKRLFLLVCKYGGHLRKFYPSHIGWSTLSQAVRAAHPTTQVGSQPDRTASDGPAIRSARWRRRCPARVSSG